MVRGPWEVRVRVLRVAGLKNVLRFVNRSLTQFDVRRRTSAIVPIAGISIF